MSWHRKNTLDEKLSRLSNLAHESASITALQGNGSVSVKLIDVSVEGLSFISAEKLLSGPSAQVSIRFTLPGDASLHFALLRLLPTVARDIAGYRYRAQFVRTQPKTIDHIVQCLNRAPARNTASTSTVPQQ